MLNKACLLGFLAKSDLQESELLRWVSDTVKLQSPLRDLGLTAALQGNPTFRPAGFRLP